MSDLLNFLLSTCFLFINGKNADHQNIISKKKNQVADRRDKSPSCRVAQKTVDRAAGQRPPQVAPLPDAWSAFDKVLGQSAHEKAGGRSLEEEGALCGLG